MRLLSAVAVVALSVGCSETSPAPGIPPSGAPASLQSIVVSGTPNLTAIGQSVQLHAKATYSDGRVVDVTDVAAWESGRTSVVSVAAGTVVSRAFGVAEVRARLENHVATAIVGVGAFEVDGSIRRVVPDHHVPVAGATLTFFPEFGAPFAVRTDSGGYFKTGPQAGSFRVEVTAPGYVLKELTVSTLRRPAHFSRLYLDPQPEPHQELFTSYLGPNDVHSQSYELVAQSSGEMHIDIRGYTYDGVLTLEVAEEDGSRVAFVKFTGKEPVCAVPGVPGCFVQTSGPVVRGAKYLLNVAANGMQYSITVSHPR